MPLAATVTLQKLVPRVGNDPTNPVWKTGMYPSTSSRRQATPDLNGDYFLVEARLTFQLPSSPNYFKRTSNFQHPNSFYPSIQEKSIKIFSFNTPLHYPLACSKNREKIWETPHWKGARMGKTTGRYLLLCSSQVHTPLRS
jgi:hypothetical protein